jgi:hypothetical protein
MSGSDKARTGDILALEYRKSLFVPFYRPLSPHLASFYPTSIKVDIGQGFTSC